MIYSSVERLEAVHKRTLLKQRFKGNTKLNDQEVKERTDATIKMANVSQESASTVSEWMTSIWNNFDDGSKKLDYYGDVLTKLGAATASSSEEIAEGVRKFAGISNTVGLSYEYAASALATITATTRESADVVGTALRTLFSRFQGLQLGKTLEDGTTLNKYSDALKIAGIDIKAQNGGLKDMDDLLDELIEKWKTLNRDQQMALAQTMGGQRQYAQLVTLLDQGDFFKQNLQTAYGSTGELDKQQKIYEESWQGAQDRLTASFEGLVKTVEDDNFFIALTDGASSFLDSLSAVIEGMGGLKVIVPIVGGLLLNAFGPQLNNAILNVKDSFNLAKTGVQGIYDSYQKQIQESYSIGFGSGEVSKMDEFRYRSSVELLEVKKQYGEVQDTLTQAEKMGAQAYIEGIETQIQKIQELIQKEQELTQVLEEQKVKFEKNIYSQYEYTDSEIQRRDRQIRGTNDYARRVELENERNSYSETAGLFWSAGNPPDRYNVEAIKNGISSGQGINSVLQSNFDFSAARKDLGRGFNEINKSLLDETNNFSPMAIGLQEIVTKFEAASKKIPNLSQEMQSKLNTSVNKIKDTMQELNNFIAVGDEDLARITGTDLIDELQNITLNTGNEDVFKGMFTSLEGLESILPGVAAEIKRLKDAYDASTEGSNNAKQGIESYKDSLARMSEQIQHTESNIELFGKMTQTLSQLAMIGTSIYSIWNTFQNDSLSTTEKVMSSLMSITMVLSGVLPIIKGIQGAILAIKTAKVADIALTKASIGLKRLELLLEWDITEEKREQLILKYAQAHNFTKEQVINILNLDTEKARTAELRKQLGLKQKLNFSDLKDATKNTLKNYAPLIAGLLKIAVVIGIIYASYKAIDYIRNDDERNIEEKTAALEKTREALDAAKTAQQEFTDNFSKYKEGTESLHTLEQDTEEYRKKLQETNEATLKLINSHKELARNSWVDDEGVIRLDESYANTLQEDQNKRVTNLQTQEAFQQNDLDRAQVQKQMADLADSTHGVAEVITGLGVIAGGIAAVLAAPFTLGGSLIAGATVAGTIGIAGNAYVESKSDEQTKAMQYLADAYESYGADVLKNKEAYLEQGGFSKDLLDGINSLDIDSAVVALSDNTAQLKLLVQKQGQDALSGESWYDSADAAEKKYANDLYDQEKNIQIEKLKQDALKSNTLNSDFKKVLKDEGGYEKVYENDGKYYGIRNGEEVAIGVYNTSEEKARKIAESKVQEDVYQDQIISNVKKRFDNRTSADVANTYSTKTGEGISVGDAQSAKEIPTQYTKKSSKGFGDAGWNELIQGQNTYKDQSLDDNVAFSKDDENFSVFIKGQGINSKSKQYTYSKDMIVKGKTIQEWLDAGLQTELYNELMSKDFKQEQQKQKDKNKKIKEDAKNFKNKNLQDVDVSTANSLESGLFNGQINKLGELYSNLKQKDPEQAEKMLEAINATDWTNSQAGTLFLKNLESLGVKLGDAKDDVENFANGLNDASKIDEATLANNAKVGSSEYQNLVAGDTITEAQKTVLSGSSLGGKIEQYLIQNADGSYTLLAEGENLIKSEGLSLPTGSSQQISAMSSVGDVLNATSEQQSTEEYSTQLIKIASQYKSCSKELSEYSKAVKQYGADSKQAKDAQNALTKALKAAAWEENAEEISKNIDVLNDEKSSAEDLATAYGNIAKQINEALGTNFTSEFIEEHADDIKKLQGASGEQVQQIIEGLLNDKSDEAKDKYIKEIEVQITNESDTKVKSKLEDIRTALEGLPSRTDLKIEAKTGNMGAAFDTVNKYFTAMLATGNYTANQITSKLKEIFGMEFDVDYEYGPVDFFRDENGKVTDKVAFDYMNKGGILPGAQAQKLQITGLKKIKFKETGGGDGDGLGGVPEGSGGGGGSKKENKEKDPADKYKSLSNLIDKLKDDLSELAALQDRVWGSDRLQNMDAQIGAIQGIISKYEEYQALIKPDVDSQKNQLINDWGAIVDDNTGTILNYEQVKNKIIDRYNSSAKEEADEKAYDTAIKLLDAYQENANTLNENTKAIKDYKRQVEDLKDAQIEYIQEVAEKTQDLKDSQIDLSRALLEASRDVFGNANLYMSQTFDEFAQGFTKLDMANAKIADYEKRLSEATDATNIKDLQDKLLEARKEASAAYKEIISLGQKFTEQLKESFDAIIERYKKITDTIDFSSNIGEAVKSMAQLSRLGTKYYAIANKTSELEINNALSRREVAQHKLDRLKDEIAEADQDIANAATEFDREEAQTRKDMYVEQAREAQLEIINSGKDALEAAQNQYEEQIEGALKVFEEAATRGAGFDFMKQVFDDFVSNEDEYLDPVNKKYDLETLNRKLQTEINKSDSKYRSNLLRSLQKEFDIRNKNHKLSEYDLEIMNKKYDITMKQIALEEARNSKTNMQLVRNAAGNWSYIFTNDEDNVTDAEQALADSQKEYWNTAKQEMLDIASRRVEAESQFRDKISAIAENENLTSAEKDRQYEVTYREWYLPLIKTLETKFNIATADLGDAEDLANVDYADDFTRGLLEKLPDQLSEDAARTLFNEVTNIEKTSSANIEDIKRKVEANIGNIDTNLNQAKELTEQSKEELNNINAAWDDYDSTLNDIVKPSLRTMSNCLRNIEQVLVKGDLLAYKENVDYAALIRDKIEGNSNYYGSAEYERDLRERDAKLNMMSRTGELSANMIDQTTDYTALARAYKEVFGADSIYQQILAEADFKGAVAQWLNIDPKGSWTSKNRTDILNKLKEVGIVQYDTGGYTGNFDNGGLAILHEKELVLNKDDTSNLLNTVDIINKLDKEVVAGLALMLQKASGGRFLDGLDTRKIEQDVKIEAHFPNVTSAEEIELSLNNLVNEAAQRAGTY